MRLLRSRTLWAVAGLALLLGASGLFVGRGTVAAPAQQNGPVDYYVYSAKFVCGTVIGLEQPPAPAVPGEYATAVNVHNPSNTEPATLYKKAVLALPEHEEVVPPLSPEQLELGPDHAFEIDCLEIDYLLGEAGLPFYKGFVVVYSFLELDVVGVYTTTRVTGTGVGLDMDVQHVEAQTIPVGGNTDSDCIPNGADITGPCRANPDQDTLTDGIDPDDDNDGPDENSDLYGDGEETVAGCQGGMYGTTDSLTKDTDNDRAIDGYECKMSTDPNDPADRPTCPDPTDTDGDGFSDCVEELGYGTLPNSLDTDGDSAGGDGCEDDKEIVDVDDNGQANILDLLAISRINLAPGPWDPVSEKVVDLNKDGANNILDVMLGSLNSVAEVHPPC